MTQQPFAWPQYVAAIYLALEVIWFTAKTAQDRSASSGVVALAVLMKLALIVITVLVLSAGGFW